MNEYLRLLKYVKPYIGRLVLAVVFMALSSILTDGVSISMIVPLVDKLLAGKHIVVGARIPLFLSSIISKINAMSQRELLNYMVIFFLVAFIFKQVFTYFQSYLVSDVSQRVIRDLRNELYAKIHTLSLDFYTKTKTGSLVSRILADTSVISNSMSEGIIDLCYQSLQLVISIVVVIVLKIVFGIPLWLLLACFVILPTVIYPVIRIGKRLRKFSRRRQEGLADISTTLYETISGARIVKAFSMEGYETKKFKGQNQNLYKLMMKVTKRNIIVSPLTEFIGVLCGALVLWAGGKEVVEGRLSAGAFVAFLAALLAMVRPFKKLSRVHAINQEALAAATRIFELQDTAPTVKERPGAADIPPLRNTVEFKGVGFRYEDKFILEGIDLHVASGSVVAIVGPSGVGKTTLVNLIPRFYEATEGGIEIDGMDLRDGTIKSLRAQIGMVTQETVLFYDTVRANIAYGKLDASPQEIERAARAANAHDFIMAFPAGYDTLIGERGYRLSGGERQRLAIARAILKNPPILILDEATSQLDTESERMVQDAIDKLMKGRTVFVIAHRLSTIINADMIIVLKDGRIVEQGRHQALLEKDGAYKRLYALQFREE